MLDFSRGSEWRKWDLHVHIPGTKLADAYETKHGEVDWERFCNIIHESDVDAIGITDYFSLDGYFIFVEKYKSLFPTDHKVFFPNLELRLNETVNKANEVIDFHIIFRPDITRDTASRFLDHLETQLSDSSGRKIVCKELNTTANFERATVSRNNIEKALNEVFGERMHWLDKAILIVPANNDGIRADGGSRRKMNIADEIDKFSNAIFGNPSNVSYFLTNDRYEDKDHKSMMKPVFSGSDSHNFVDLKNWLGKQVLIDNIKYTTWVKADLTFEGLQQTLLQPEDRVYIGIIPPSLETKNRNKQNYISSVSVKRVDSPINQNEHWFDFTLPLNNGLISIVGNKGSGKSALSDIISLFANCKSMERASFLNNDRFKKENKKYANDYVGQITWEDGKKDNPISLNSNPILSAIENAQYLPQRNIEEVCNDLGNGFRNEINKVIFSYVDITERGTASNLKQLIEQKTIALEEIIGQKTINIREVNSSIIALEDKLTTSYKEFIDSCLAKYQEKLDRHETSKPLEVKKLEQNNPEYVEKLSNIDTRIIELENRMTEKEADLFTVNIALDELHVALTRIENVQVTVKKISEELHELSEKYHLPDLIIKADFESLMYTVKSCIDKYIKTKGELVEELGTSEEDDTNTSLSTQLKSAKKIKEVIISSANDQEKIYQKYVEDLYAWEEQKKAIIGSNTLPDTLEYYKHERNYIDSKLQVEYNEKFQKRNSIIKEIFDVKQKIATIYSSIYEPVEKQLNHLIGDMDDKIAFVTELSLSNPNIGDELLNYVNKTYSGTFSTVNGATIKMKELINATDFNNYESTMKFISNVLVVTSEDRDFADKKVKDRATFYEKLCSLNYIESQYNLTVDNKHLEALSPGEKGSVLLVFYLALSRDERPIIIDQPEDNLDNQSVFCKLVKCIKEAKKKRQVIIVTHNPNIAVACDSEQIIYCSIDKSTYRIKYKSGSIENPTIKNHVIDVLEGTLPAFDLRRKKYRIGQ